MATSLPDGKTLGAKIKSDMASKAAIASPTFTGTPKAPTAALGNSSTQIATTAFVQNQLNASVLTGEGSAAYANSVYGGRNILDYFTEAELSTKIAAGDFSGLRLGDYITKSVTIDGTAYSRKWMFAHFDGFYLQGDTQLNSHHIVMVPDNTLGNAVMNETDTTEGGYQASNMWTVTIPKCAEAITTAFTSAHVLPFRTTVSSAMSATTPSSGKPSWNGSSTAWVWVDATCNLMSEPQYFGTTIFSSSGDDVGVNKWQFPLFARLPHIRAYFWLSAVASSSRFCSAGSLGDASAYVASTSSGVRPFFLYR